MDSTGLARRTTTCNRPPTHAIVTVLATVTYPWAGASTAPEVSRWLRPERASTIDQWYVSEDPETLWIANDTSIGARLDFKEAGRLFGVVNDSSV